MKTRNVTLTNGQTFAVPQGIQRIDTKSTHGWQVRYQGTKYYSDGPAGKADPAASLMAATEELLLRIQTLPAPVVLKRGPSANKTSDLPAGISGPIVRQRAGSETRTAELSVLLPRFGVGSVVKAIYIGSERTYNVKRYRAALAKALELRREALDRYEQDATEAKRKLAKAYRTLIRAQGQLVKP